LLLGAINSPKIEHWRKFRSARWDDKCRLSWLSVLQYSRLLFLPPVDQGSWMVSGNRSLVLSRFTSRDDRQFREFSSIE
jgi:hypothetical protein